MKAHEITAAFISRTTDTAEVGAKVEAVKQAAEQQGFSVHGVQITTIDIQDIPDQGPTDSNGGQ